MSGKLQLFVEADERAECIDIKRKNSLDVGRITRGFHARLCWPELLLRSVA